MSTAFDLLKERRDTTEKYNRENKTAHDTRNVELTVGTADALIDAFDAMKAERDAAAMDRDIQTQRLNAALSLIKLDVDSGEIISNRIAELCRNVDPNGGYFVKSYVGEGQYDDFEDAWAAYVRNGTMPDATAAPPAPDAGDGETITQLLTWARNSHEHADAHAALIEDGHTRCAAEAHGLAIRHLIEIVRKLQKGEQS